MSIPVAALVATLFAGSEIGSTLTPHLLLAGFGLALLLPVIPFGLEMYALRRLIVSRDGARGAIYGFVVGSESARQRNRSPGAAPRMPGALRRGC